MMDYIDLCWLNFWHYFSVSMTANYYYDFFRLYPEYFTSHVKCLLIISEFCAISCLSLTGFFASKWIIFDKNLKPGKYINFPCVPIFTLCCVITMFTSVFAFFAGVAWKNRPQYAVFSLVLFTSLRLTCNCFGYFVV